MKNLNLVAMLTMVALAGCASTEISPQAKNVRVISDQQAHACKFIDHVSSNNGNTLMGNPEEDAKNKALNRVAALGGNALHITSTNSQIAPSGVGSIFTLSGEAYLCK